MKISSAIIANSIVVASASLNLPASAPQNSPISASQNPAVGFTSNFGGCNDSTPFVMDYGNYWRCASDAMDCYNTVVQGLMKSVHSSACSNGTCIYHSSSSYAKDLRNVMFNSISKQSQSVATPGASCSWAKWTAELDYVANIVLQRASRCQVDYAAIFELYDMTQQLFNLEEKCLAAGMTLPGSNQATAHNSPPMPTSASSPNQYVHQSSQQSLPPSPVSSFPQIAFPQQATLTTAAVGSTMQKPLSWIWSPKAGE